MLLPFSEFHIVGVEISVDRVKRDQTLEEGELDFADAGLVFIGPVFTFEDARFAYPEPRFATYGLLHDRLVAVIWTKTDRGHRVMSMRKANDREQARYRQRLG